MKQILLFIIIFCGTQTLVSQEKKGTPFFTSSLNFTFGRNEFDEGFGDDEPFLAPAAVLIRAGFGYQFNKRFAASFNAGFDHHWKESINAIPTYGTLRYNIAEKHDNSLFIESSIGKMWRPSDKYPDGNYYGFGIGLQISGEKRWNTLLKLDFHRKTIPGFENSRLDSVSLGFGFSFF